MEVGQPTSRAGGRGWEPACQPPLQCVHNNPALRTDGVYNNPALCPDSVWRSVSVLAELEAEVGNLLVNHATTIINVVEVILPGLYNVYVLLYVQE